MGEAQRKNAVASENEFPQRTPYWCLGLTSSCPQALALHGFSRKQPSPCGTPNGVIAQRRVRVPVRDALGGPWM
jgi:hypothetical protein